MLSKLSFFLTICTVWSQPQSKFLNPLKHFFSGSTRIFHGFSAEKGQFPWQVALFIPNNNNIGFCGGTIISDQWILTAAHCLERADDKIRILLGTVKSTRNDPYQLELFSIQWGIYPDYDPWSYDDDIGMVMLPQRLVFNKFIKPIRLSRHFEKGTATVCGWGDTGDGRRSASLTYSIVKIETCNCGLKFCSTPDPKSLAQNVCGGDSGSGLVVDAFSNHPTQIGIVSTFSGNCGVGESASFTRTEFYLDWIFMIIRMKI